MKAIRTFRSTEDHLTMRSVIVPSEDSLDDPQVCEIVALISPDFPHEVLDGDAIKMSVLDSEFPLDLRLQEMQHFINVLKTMYYGS